MIDDKWKKIITACLAVLLVIGVGLWFFCAGRNDVSDIRERADDTRAELTDAGRAQQSEAAAIESAAEAVSRSSDSIRDSQQTAGEIQRTERTDAEIISGSEEILQEVRARGGTENQN